MSLISLQQAQLAYGHVALLDHVDFSLETQERVGLIGRNGTGKSSLLRILAGQEMPDDGMLQCQQGLRRAFVAQEPRLNPTRTVFESVSEGLAQVREWIDQYTRGEGSLDALQNAIELVTNLGGAVWPALDEDRTAGNHRGSQERTCVGQVWLDGNFAALDFTRLNTPLRQAELAIEVGARDLYATLF